MLDNFTIESSTEAINSQFNLVLENNVEISITLMEVNIHTNTKEHQNFSLIFQGPLQPFLNQGIRIVRHPLFGESEIFLVPIAKEENRFVYEAVFNRIYNK